MNETNPNSGPKGADSASPERSSGDRSRPRGVLDPAWEDELRQGQEAEGEAGSVDAELALVHLLRHVREPEALAPDQLDNLWKEIAAEVAPAPWWKRAWLLWAAPVAVTAAVLLVIVLPEPKGESNEIARQDQKAEQAAAAPTGYAQKSEERTRGPLEESEATADKAAEVTPDAQAAAAPSTEGAIGGAIAARSETAQRLEKSFVKLAPYGRASIRVSVDVGYDELRSQLLTEAKGGG